MAYETLLYDTAGAIALRDGAFGDYSQAAPEDQPNPSNIISAEPPRG